MAIPVDRPRAAYASPRSHFLVESLERRILFDINDYVLAFVSGINLVDAVSSEEHGGIYIMKPDGSGLRQITQFKTSNFQFSGHGLNLPDDHPSFSPDGKRIVFTSSRHDTSGIFTQDNFEIYTMDANGTDVRRLTFNDSLDTNPVWSPDGTKIAFTSRRDGGDFDLFVMNADGTNPVRLTDFGNDSEVEPAWSPDGSKIAFTRVTFSGVLGVLGAQKDIWVMNADGSGKRQITNLFNEEHDPSWNPSGTQLAISSERGRIVPKPPFGDTVIIRVSDGAEVAVPTSDFAFSAGDPAWSPDGSKLAVFKADLPVLTSPLVLYTMNPDGSAKHRLGGIPGLINIHPSWGVAADSDNDGRLDYLENDNISFDQVALPGNHQAGALLGAAMALADLDHDGFLDLVAGLPGENVGGVVDAGRIVIVRGTAQGPDFSQSFGPLLPRSIDAGLFNLRQANGRFGQTLVAGDFNGDGFKDLAIGAPGQNRIFVMFGGINLVQQLIGAGGEFGVALAAGDFNDDGREDLAVGAPSEQRAVAPGASVAAGAVRVFYGSTSGLSTSTQLIDQGSLPLTDAGREEAGDRFGAALAAGDLNGDLVDDLAIGVPGEDTLGIANAGIVHVLPGRDGLALNPSAGVARDGRNLPSPHTGLQANANFGEVLTVGDYNGDIFDVHDLVVGTPRQDVAGILDAGVVAIFGGGISTGGSISLPATGTAFTSQQVGGPAPVASMRFGQTLVSGDFTGDAIEDLALSAPNQSASGAPRAGIVYLINGVKNTASTSTCQFCVDFNPLFGSGGGLSLPTAQQITAASVRSTASIDDHFGASLILPSANTLAAGDLDKDGQADLIIGTPERNFGTLANTGQVSIRYGIKVGTSVVSPADIDLPNNGQIAYTLEWTHPERWRQLETIHLRLVSDEHGVLAWIKFDEATNTISIGDPRTGLFTLSGTPGSNKKLKAGEAELILRNSRVIGTGEDGPSVALTLALKLKPHHIGPHGSADYRVEVFASDDNGNSQGFEQAGVLHVGPRAAAAHGGAAVRRFAGAITPSDDEREEAEDDDDEEQDLDLTAPMRILA